LCIFFIVSILYTSANFFPFLLQAEKADRGYGMSKVEASQCTSMIYWLVIIAPIAGTLLDSYGRRLATQIICTSGAIVFLLIMHFTDVSPWILISGLGLMFAFLEQNSYTILTKSFEHLGGSVEGICFGIMGVFLNSGLMVIAPLVGFFHDITGTYHSQIQLYLFFLSTGLVLSLCLCSMDKNGILNEKPGDSETLEEPLLAPVQRSVSYDNIKVVPERSGSFNRAYDNIKMVPERSGSFKHLGA
jgi:MFS family permease